MTTVLDTDICGICCNNTVRATMSKNRYVSNSSRGIFDEEDEIDDNEFLSRVRPNRNDLLGQNFSNQSLANAHQQKQQVIEATKDVEQRTLQSTERTLRLLRESENIGTATAEELVRQREQLQNTDRRLDEINSNLRVSQKHIQGIKSIFGNFKNMLSGKSSLPARSASIDEPSVAPNISAVRRSTLCATLAQTNSNLSSMEEHPGLRIRGLTDNEVTKPSNVQSSLDNNLDEILGSVTRLKGLALGLGEEIDSQNDLVENIIGKADKADINMGRQNKEISRILKK
ncbi:synaptosomal-associated protein 29 isoform X2 [Daktulosphaira vitifoliae]|uniref:synaptosomal-associated protein 29 isoform X2 n=1 Tax=Daktulosphaira vitifoliae TaxID=58002 RepID=UPI0021A9E98F|nr:synaptosomal-associated protein 29 isoform X2 [Daktulosphaira vitifoliae]